MSIQILNEKSLYHISAGGTSYVLWADDERRLLTLYWGKRLQNPDLRYLLPGYGDGASFDLAAGRQPYTLPARGLGWYGIPAVSAVNADGNDLAELRLAGAEVAPGKPALEGLPSVYAEDGDGAETLTLTLTDALTGLTVLLRITAMEAYGTVTQSLEVQNRGSLPLTLREVQSASVPLYGRDYKVLHLKGAWARERKVVHTPLGQGGYTIESQRGASGHEENPFIALTSPNADETHGDVYGLVHVYSGSFSAGAFVDNIDNTRLYMGMNPRCFSWRLAPGASFQAPETLLLYSGSGLEGWSQLSHRLIRQRVCRGFWRDRPRPILLNNWEATYFDFDEEKILSIARKAKEAEVELLVLDDGWFGKRDNDFCSLGDWTVNRKKLPSGLDGLARKVNKLGLAFGTWMEPEMISPDSDLYRAHPDWCLHAPGRPRTEARHQLILDLTRTEVQEYVLQAVSNVLASGPIAYLKWDMNRNMTEPYSPALPPDAQGEVQHRYILGLYRVLAELNRRFPEVLFEGCSGGGGRFDCGMLAYMPQIWTSDDSDALERLEIQWGTSLVYPACTMGAHVSAVPNHQTGRMTSMQMRADVAMSGNFGFELDLNRLSPEDMEVAVQSVRRSRAWAPLLREGSFHRLTRNGERGTTAWQFLSPDGREALACCFFTLAKPNPIPLRLPLRGLLTEAVYADDKGNTYTGEALMQAGLLLPTPQGDLRSMVLHLRTV